MDELTGPLRDVVVRAMTEARQCRASALEPIHLVAALCDLAPPPIGTALDAIGKSSEGLAGRARELGARNETETGPDRISTRVMLVFGVAKERADGASRELDPAHLFAAALMRPDRAVNKLIEAESIPVERLVVALLGDGANAERAPPVAAEAPDGVRPATPTLDRFGKDYTALARQGKLDPVIGRRDELKKVITVLIRKQKNNPVLVGEPGVGKTAIVEGLAQLAVQTGAPHEVEGLRLVEVLMSSLVAGTKYRGEFEERVESIIQEAGSDPKLVLFIDEIHMVVGAGGGQGAMDAANLLKPALARGGLRCVGATTPAEYKKYIEQDSALERRFQPVLVEEPSAEETSAILNGLRPTYQAHHNVVITDEALAAAVELSVRYLPDRRLPDKARDLLDQAAANKRLLTLSPVARPSEAPEVTRNDVAHVVSEWTRVPVDRLTSDEHARFARLEQALAQRVVGQAHAVSAVAKVVRTARAGLSAKGKPHGVFLFTGPSGVGKTELAKALAEFLFGDERNLVRFDMSEYMEEHSVNKLIGAPPSYVGYEQGGQLTNAVRRNPYSVVLFDEIEKSHTRVSDLFLQVFDEGRLTDNEGRNVDFCNTVIIMTSNIGALPERQRRPVGFAVVGDAEHESASALPSQDELRALVRGHFRPELINRIGHIVPFHSLGEPELRAIILKIIGRVQERLAERGIRLEIAESAYAALTKAAFRPERGARELEAVIEREVVQPLAEGVFGGRFSDGATIDVVSAGSGVELRARADTSTVQTTRSPVGLGSVVHTLLQPQTDETAGMLLMDIVKSTELVVESGDTVFSSAIGDLYAALQSHPMAAKTRFLKCTGDGFLAVFADIEPALAMARTFQRARSQRQLALRFVLHFGRIKVGPGGDPLGAEVHRLFRVEAAKDRDRIDGPEGAPGVPEFGRVVLTRAALDKLAADERAKFDLLGRFRLKGFDEPCEIWAEREDASTAGG